MSELQLRKPLEKVCRIVGCDNKIKEYNLTGSDDSIIQFKSKFCKDHTCSFANYTSIRCTNMSVSNTIRTCLVHTCTYKGCKKEVAYSSGHADTLCEEHTIDSSKYEHSMGYRTGKYEGVGFMLAIISVPVILFGCVVFSVIKKYTS